MKHLLTDLTGDIEANTVVAGELNTPFTATDRLARQKLSKEATDFTQTVEQMG